MNVSLIRCKALQMNVTRRFRIGADKRETTEVVEEKKDYDRESWLYAVDTASCCGL